MDLLYATEAPTITDNYLINAGLETLIALVYATGDLIDSSDTTDKQIGKQLAEKCWPMLLACLSMFLERTFDELFIQDVLRCIQSYTNTCAVSALSTPRDAFLTSLCKYVNLCKIT